jgi:hypothetical protein
LELLGQYLDMSFFFLGHPAEEAPGSVTAGVIRHFLVKRSAPAFQQYGLFQYVCGAPFTHITPPVLVLSTAGNIAFR